MRAVVQDRYGPPDVLRLVDVARPVPKENEVLVRVHATTVNRTDCACRAGTPFVARLYTGVRRPKWRISGSELAGEVEAVGAAVGEFAVGDRVLGCNAGTFGAHAELVCVREEGPLAKMPGGVTFEEAAAVCDGAILALNALRPAGIRPGQRLLVYGASGAMGTAGVQLGKHFGAHVTAVCNTKNLELVRSLGADRVIDYTQEDFTADGETYDVVFDAVGKLSFRHCRGSLAEAGVYVPTDGWLNLALGPLTRRRRGKRVLFTIPPRYRKADVLLLVRLLEQGAYRPVVDRSYPLEQVVEASRYVETEQKTGNVVLTVNGGRAGR
jgi:NADPH:quinone reductase-like Zn-dependent oxidoreductase